MPVRVKDKGAAELMARLTQTGVKQKRGAGGRFVKMPTVSVGIMGAAAQSSDNGPNIAQIAVWHEFGTTDGVVPPRSFIRGYYDENEAVLKRKMRAAAKAVASGRFTLEQALNILGLYIVEGIRDRIDAHIPPALKPATVAAKRRKGYAKPTTPLVGTRQLYNAITHEVS